MNSLIIFFKINNFMHLSLFALASSEWGIARFTTDSFALIALGVLVTLPIQLLKDKRKSTKPRRRLLMEVLKFFFSFLLYFYFS